MENFSQIFTSVAQPVLLAFALGVLAGWVFKIW